MTVAIAGNPNCGKTTVFNLLTGDRAKVGNLPGVTVENRRGNLLSEKKITVVDIPGVYSLVPFSEDEKAAGDLLLSRPDFIVNVVDATNLSRSLFLTFQLLKLSVPMIVAVNMSDELKKLGQRLDVSLLSSLLGVEVLSVCGIDGSGISALENRIKWYCSSIKRDCSAVSGEQISFSSFESDSVHQYRKIENICKKVLSSGGKKTRFSEKIDRIVFGKFSWWLVFFSVLSAVFFLTFYFPGGFLRDRVGDFFDLLSSSAAAFLFRSGVQDWLCGLLCDGILKSMGGVLSFLPTVLILFFCLGLLEDCGYLARVAVLADRPFSRLGLSGRSAIPLLMGFGCSVPAVMACRTIPGRQGRLKSIFLVPFASCGAKIPIYMVFTKLFFKEHSFLVLLFLYLLGVASGFVFLFLFKIFGVGQVGDFLLELPPYRFPRLKNTLVSVREKCLDFLRKVFTVIFLSGMVLWFSENCFWGEKNLLQIIGGFFSPLFSPLGFGNFQSVAALLSGFAAKEAVVSSFCAVLGDLQFLQGLFTPVSALSFMVFTLFYPPCLSALAAIRHEAGGFFCLAAFLFQTAVAWLISFAVFRTAGYFF